MTSCKCVRLHNMTRYKLLRNCQILSVFQISFTSNSFRIQSCPDPAKSFKSDMIRNYTTEKADRKIE
jgi:hypothetical protein